MQSRSAAGEQDGELLASYPADASTASEMSAFRTTWLVSSREALKSGGLFDRYQTALRAIDAERFPGAEEALNSMVANQWIPIAFARAHFEACEELGIPEARLLASMKSAEGGQVRRAWHAQVISAAQKPDASPWVLLPNLPRWWPRGAVGGGVALYRVAANEARLDFYGNPLFEVPFYTVTTRAVHALYVSHFCKDASVLLGTKPKNGSGSLVLRWR